jgi:DNA-binding response OmpR family regulator
MSDGSDMGATMTSSPLYEFRPFRLDPVKRLLYRDGDPVPLTPKAVEFLLVLLENRGRRSRSTRSCARSARHRRGVSAARTHGDGATGIASPRRRGSRPW